MFKSLRLVLALSLSVLAIPFIVSTSASATTKPSCVVSLSPTATETLYAIGAGPEVQAVDSQALAAEARDQRSHAREGGLERRQVRDLTADMTGQAHRGEIVAGHGEGVQALVRAMADALDTLPRSGEPLDAGNESPGANAPRQGAQSGGREN